MLYDRKTKKLSNSEPESKAVKFLYKTVVGRIILKFVILQSLSNILGKFYETKFSKRRIKNFVKANNLNIENIDQYKTFNDFFTRKYEFDLKFNNTDMISVAESKLSIYDIDEESILTIKKQKYNLETLLDDKNLAKKYHGGKCLIFRLCVDNYHRYCYFDSGKIIKQRYIKGKLHTVRPIAYEDYKPLIENTRNYSVLQTDNFGEAIQMEVGAILVGKFTNEDCTSFIKGFERGYFELGGSTVVVLLKKDKLILDSDLQELINTETEISVNYGEKLGIANI